MKGNDRFPELPLSFSLPSLWFEREATLSLSLSLSPLLPTAYLIFSLPAACATDCFLYTTNTSAVTINHFVPITQGLLTIMTSSTVEVHGGTVLQAVRYDKKFDYRGMGGNLGERSGMSSVGMSKHGCLLLCDISATSMWLFAYTGHCCIQNSHTIIK